MKNKKTFISNLIMFGIIGIGSIFFIILGTESPTWMKEAQELVNNAETALGGLFPQSGFSLMGIGLGIYSTGKTLSLLAGIIGISLVVLIALSQIACMVRGRNRRLPKLWTTLTLWTIIAVGLSGFMLQLMANWLMIIPGAEKVNRDNLVDVFSTTSMNQMKALTSTVWSSGVLSGAFFSTGLVTYMIFGQNKKKFLASS